MNEKYSVHVVVIFWDCGYGTQVVEDDVLVKKAFQKWKKTHRTDFNGLDFIDIDPDLDEDDIEFSICVTEYTFNNKQDALEAIKMLNWTCLLLGQNEATTQEWQTYQIYPGWS